MRTRAITRSEQLQSILVIRDNEHLTMQSPEELYSFKLLTDDTVFVSTYADSVYLVGEVVNPGAYPFMPGLSIKEYISLAGGPTDSGSLRRIKVIRNGSNLSSKKSGYIQAGDIIQVKKKGLAIIKEYTSVVSPIVSIILTGYAIGLFGGK